MKNKYFEDMRIVVNKFRSDKLEIQEEIDEIYRNNTRPYSEECFQQIGILDSRIRSLDSMFPYNRGQMFAYRSYIRQIDSCFNIDDIAYTDDENVQILLDTYRDARVTEFVVTSKSSALMKFLYTLGNHGCTIESPCDLYEITTDDDGRPDEIKHIGLRIRI